MSSSGCNIDITTARDVSVQLERMKESFTNGDWRLEIGDWRLILGVKRGQLRGKAREEQRQLLIKEEQEFHGKSVCVCVGARAS